jgi:hypothetical protein
MTAAPRICALVLFAGGCGVTPSAPTDAVLRVNLVGYAPSDPKVALLSSDAPLSGRFSVGSFEADIGPDQGAWGPFRHNYRLDFSAVREPGRYRVRFGRIASPEFAVGDDVYAHALEKLRFFLRLQRCGDNPITGKKCHQQDGFDSVTGEPVDLVGGWHDAGDSLKHMITSTYCVAALYLAGERDEADWGAALMRKIHPRADVIYVQIADDRDHVGWRFWHDDKVDYGRGRGGPRPGWRATGKPEGPKYRNASTGLASLAGRAAAALALAGDLDRARSAYRLAKENPGNAHSVPVLAPHHYGEQTYLDDLEWAAVELTRATGEAAFKDEAVRFAHMAGDAGWMGRATHGHYEFFPYVNLAHWRLHELADPETKARLEGYYRTGLDEVRRRAQANPYRVGTPLVWCSTNDAVAFATQAVLYERMTGDAQFRGLATEARDWVLGRNPWGVSFVTGVPEGGPAARDVHHPFHALKSEHRPVGGVVDGPLRAEINRQFAKYFNIKDDPLARFQSEEAVYHDHISDFSTNEPILDGTVALLFLLKIWR